jgi:hypothetical protein
MHDVHRMTGRTYEEGARGSMTGPHVHGKRMSEVDEAK